MSNIKEMSAPAPETVSKPTRHRIFIVVILFIGIVVAYLDRVNISVLGANDEFVTFMGIQGQPVQIGMMMSMFLAAYAVANVVLSPLGDYLGPRKSMMICIIIWTISLFIGGWAIGFGMFIIARIILGIGEGWYWPLQNLFVKNWFPPHERGRANAVWTIGQAVAPALAMPVFAFIIGNYGWRASFYFCIVIGMIPLYLLWRYSTDTPNANKRVNAAELKYIEDALAKESSNIKTKGELTFLDKVRPFIKSYKYWLVVSWWICLQIITWGLIAWIPIYLKTARGFSWTEMGWMASLPFALAIVTKACNGWLNDKIGRSAPLLFAAMFLGGISIYGAAHVEGKYAAALFLAGAYGFSTMATSACLTLLQGLVPARSVAVAVGLMAGIAIGISTLSPVIIGSVIEVTGDYNSGLLTLLGVNIFAATVAMILTIKKC